MNELQIILILIAGIVGPAIALIDSRADGEADDTRQDASAPTT